MVGWFSNFNGIEVPHGIVKLSENGEIDQLFNENQKSIALDQTFMQLDAKLVQLDSLIFIKNRSKIISFNLDGTLNTIFTAPLSFLNVHDIITLKDSSQNSGGKKAGLTYNQRDFLFALGSFKKTENDDPSFVIKLDLGDNATSINSKISSRKFNGPQFKIYPNPAGEQLTINAENLNGTYRVTLFNLIGEKVLESNIKYSGSEVNKLVDIRSLQPGMYLITISSGSKTLFTNKLIKGYN